GIHEDRRVVRVLAGALAAVVDLDGERAEEERRLEQAAARLGADAELARLVRQGPRQDVRKRGLGPDDEGDAVAVELDRARFQLIQLLHRELRVLVALLVERDVPRDDADGALGGGGDVAGDLAEAELAVAEDENERARRGDRGAPAPLEDDVVDA